MKKRISSKILSLAVIASMLSASMLAAAANPFSDVKSSDWYYDAVEYVYENNLMNGTSATAFNPSAKTSRGMIVTILYRMAGSPAGGTANFTDVKAGAYYEAPIAWATGSSAIAGGYGNNKFGPDDSITREQMAVFLYNYAKYCGKSFASAPAEITSFSDSASVSSWAKSAMEWAYGAKLITGTSGNRLDPKGSTTRAQAATMIMRYIEAFGKAPGSGSSEYFDVSFNKNDGVVSLMPTVQVFPGQTVSQPEDPVREGYVFDGWYTAAEGGEKFDFSTVITASMTLYAHWIAA